jgi:hypothetical protein
MFAYAASVITQSAAHILRFGVLLASSSLTGRGATSQSPITGLGASTKLVRLSHSLESSQQLAASTVARPHLHISRRVFPGRANGQNLTVSSTWTLIRPIASDTPYGRQLTSSLGPV